MSFDSRVTDAAILATLGERVGRLRIEAGLTQAELAERAGIGKRTLERLEAGRGTELVTLIRVLRILDSLEGFESLLPARPPSPIEQLKLHGKQRQRASHPRGQRARTARDSVSVSGAPAKPWTWGAPPATTQQTKKIPRPARKKV